MQLPKMRIVFSVVAAVFLCGAIFPLAVSISNERTAFGILESYDTHLNKQTLTSEMFTDAVWTYHRYTDNPLQQILKLLLERRLKVVGVDKMADGNWKYHVRAYTYFNISISDGWFGIGGEPMLDIMKPMREF